MVCYGMMNRNPAPHTRRSSVYVAGYESQHRCMMLCAAACAKYGGKRGGGRTCRRGWEAPQRSGAKSGRAGGEFKVDGGARVESKVDKDIVWGRDERCVLGGGGGGRGEGAIS